MSYSWTIQNPFSGVSRYTRLNDRGIIIEFENEIQIENKDPR